MTQHKKRFVSAAVVAIIFIIAIFILQNGGAGKVTTEDEGIAFTADGRLFEDSNSQTTKKVYKENDATVFYFSTNTGSVERGTKSETGFSFDLNGEPKQGVTVDSYFRESNIFLKKGAYAQMTKTEITEDQFEYLKYYYSTDEMRFELVTAYDEEKSKDYYLMEDFVNLETDFYPVVYSLTSADPIEGLCIKGNHTEDSLLKIVNAMAASLGSGGTYQCTADEQSPHTTIVTVENASFPEGSKMTNWVKFIDETLTWERTAPEKGSGEEKADKILSLLEGTEKAIVVRCEPLEEGLDVPMTMGVMNEENYCLDTVLEIKISLKGELSHE